LAVLKTQMNDEENSQLETAYLEVSNRRTGLVGSLHGCNRVFVCFQDAIFTYITYVLWLCFMIYLFRIEGLKLHLISK